MVRSELVVHEFCRISMEFIRNGINQKAYQIAAQKLATSVETVTQCVQGLTHLLTESVRLMLNENDFHESVSKLGFGEKLQSQLYQLYCENREEMRRTLSTMSMGLPYYHNLEWRFEVKLASRSLSHQMEPVVLLKLHTDDCGIQQTKVLEADPTNLVHLTQTLGAALEEMKSSHCRRILRNV